MVKCLPEFEYFYCVLEKKNIFKIRRSKVTDYAALSNNSLFVGQLYDDKSLALRARDLIFFTTDLQTVNYYLTIHCWS